uniref:Transforming, acidic coiled-coil containing protein 1 n=1 Tax=Mus musculus TaxID=10090 RepID=A0A1B0GRI7_MOUSE
MSQRTFPVRPLEVLAKSYKTSFSRCPSAGGGGRASGPASPRSRWCKAGGGNGQLGF